MKHVHILGIGGTFMGGVAVLAKSLGFKVTGSDLALYPPMSTLLAAEGIEIIEGYDNPQLLAALKADEIIIGNALSRGKPVVEWVLNQGIPYTSGPEWLWRHVLSSRWVLAVAGTHGKTTTSSLLAWILECAGLTPGFLIGGEPLNFGVSARLGEGPFFVIEADEYDTAFFDKRSKFVHYHPKTFVINNLEYDHADIFPNLEAIQRQFHHAIRMVPGIGQIIYPSGVPSIESVLSQGAWSTLLPIGHADNEWFASDISPDGSAFSVYHRGRLLSQVEWDLLGHHNISNALSAMAAAHHAGVLPEVSVEALKTFRSVARRLQWKGKIGAEANLFDDFAHHPTAIALTLQGLRAKVGKKPIVAIVDIRSNTMKMGVHRDTLAPSLKEADMVILHPGVEAGWDVQKVADDLPQCWVINEVNAIVEWVKSHLSPNWQVVVMSNGGFGGLHQKLLELTPVV